MQKSAPRLEQKKPDVAHDQRTDDRGQVDDHARQTLAPKIAVHQKRVAQPDDIEQYRASDGKDQGRLDVVYGTCILKKVEEVLKKRWNDM